MTTAMYTGQSFADPGGGGDIQRRVNVDLDADVSGFTQGMQQATSAAQALGSALGGVAQQANSLSKMAGKTLMHFSVGDFAALGAATGVAARFEHQLGTLNATAAITGASMGQMKTQLTGVFQQFPVWREQVVALATAISNMGVKRPTDIGRLTASYTKLGAATGEDSGALASSGIGLAKQMGNLDASRIDKYNNSLVTLSKTAGVSAQSITDFASALAPFARQAGIGEAAVLGISTAFQKAGADGQVAANAFNSLLSTITSLKQTGGNVAQFSSFLGQSQQQFKGQTPLEAVNQIFQQVGRGGPQAAAFAQQNLGGIRAQGAIQRVVQTGDLSNLVGLSQSSAQNTNNLDKSSGAAFDGLTNSMSMLRNEFTEMATLIGGPLVTGLTKMAQAIEPIVHAFTSVLKAMGPVPGIIAAGAGVAAIPAAVGLAHSGLGAAMGIGRYALGSNSGWRTAQRHGREVAAAVAAGMSPDDAMDLNETGRRIKAGSGTPGNAVPWHMNAMFNAGMRMSPPPAGTPTVPGGGVWGAVRTAFNAGGAGVWNLSGKGASWFTNQQNQPINPRIVGATSPYTGRLAPGTPALPGTAGWGQAARNMAQYPFLLSSTLGSTPAAMARALRAQLPNTGAGMLGQAALTGVSGVGRAWSGFSSIAGKAANLAMGPAGLAAMVGLPLAGQAISAIQNQMNAPKDISGAMSGGANAFDQALDETSSNLAHFGDSVTSAADSLQKFANLTPQQVSRVTGEDVSAVTKGDYKIADQTMADVAKASKNDPKAMVQYLNSLGIQAPDMSGAKGTQIKRDLLSTMGVNNTSLVNQVMDDFTSGLNKKGGSAGQTNFDVLGALASGLTGDAAKNILNAGVSGIVAGTQGAGQAGMLPQLADILRLSGQATSGQVSPNDRNANLKTAAAFLEQATGVKADDILGQIPEWSHMGRAGALTGDASQVTQKLVTAFANTQGGKDYMAAQGITLEQLQTGAAKGMALPGLNSATNVDVQRLRTMGPLGGQLAGGRAFGKAIEAPGSSGAALAASNEMLLAALKTAGGGVGGVGGAAQAGTDLRAIAAQSGGQIAEMGNNAAAAADQLAKLAQITLTPSQANLQTVQQANQALSAGIPSVTNPNPSDEQVAAAAAAPLSAGNAVNDQTSRNRQMLDTVKSFNRQMQRSTEDYNTQVSYANQAFGIQQERTTESYTRQRARTERDYGISVARAEQANYVQRERATRDFGIQQERATQQYELQVTRETQAAALQQSRAQQQYDTQVSRQHRDYNTQVTRETEAFHRSQTRELEDYHTQMLRSEEQYQLGRARTIEDYNTQVARSSEEFHIGQARQREQYNIQAGRSERDFNKQQLRTQEQFTLQLKRQAETEAQTIYDPWTRVQRKATTGAANLLRNLTKQNANIAKQIAEIAEAKQLGVSEQTIQELDLSNPANAQELDALIKSLKRNPQMVGQINAQISTRVDSTKALTQTNDSLSFKNTMEDFITQNKNAWADYKQSVADGLADLQRSMREGTDDFTRHAQQAQDDEDKNLARMAVDHATEMRHSADDFHRNARREQQDFTTQITQGAEDLATALSDGAADFALAASQAAQDLAISLAQGAQDFFIQMSQAVTDFDTQMGDLEADFETIQANAAADEARTLSDMATDFSVTMSQAATDHETALTQMTTAYQLQQQRAGEDLTNTFHTYTGGLNQSIIDMTAAATSEMEAYAPGAAASWAQALADSLLLAYAAIDIPGIADLLGNPINTAPGSGVGTGWQSQPGGPGNGIPNGAGQAASPGGGGGGARGPQAHAAGGIPLSPQYAMVGDGGPELILPLNSRGQDFMAGLIARSLAQGITMAVSSAPNTSQSVANDNTVSFAGADIKVVAADPNRMAKELAAKAKLKRLVSPVRH